MRTLSGSSRSNAREGILSEIKKREYYDKPSVKKKKKAIAARKKAIKSLKKYTSR